MMILGTVCLLYNIMSFINFHNGSFSKLENIDYRKFRIIYKVFIACTTIVALLFIAGGVLLIIGGEFKATGPLMAIGAFILYVLSLIIWGKIGLWKYETALAMGIGNGGLFPIIITMFPLWGPFVILSRLT